MLDRQGISRASFDLIFAEEVTSQAVYGGAIAIRGPVEQSGLGRIRVLTKRKRDDGLHR